MSHSSQFLLTVLTLCMLTVLIDMRRLIHPDHHMVYIIASSSVLLTTIGIVMITMR